MYIVEYRITFEKLIQMIKEKLSKKIKNEKKLVLEVIESSFYPFQKDCHSFQEVWLSETNSIKIDYQNVDKWWKEYKDAENWLKTSKAGDTFIFQEMNDKKPTEILIKFKYEDIIQAIDILVCYVNKSISTRRNFLVKFNNQILEIYPADMSVDKEEDSLQGLFVTMEEDKFVNTIIKNIKEENILCIITEDWHDFSAISGLAFRYESYYYDENYLSEKEYNRLEKIETSWVYKK